jgi:DNA-binding MarR family transcriptional regulator
MIKMKDIFNSHFTLAILSKLYQGYRPSQIAAQLKVTPQDIHYHINRMVNADLIYKDTSDGIKWKLTEKGRFILKQNLTGTVNSFNNYQIRIIPTRLDNLSFAFKILSPIKQVKETFLYSIYKRIKVSRASSHLQCGSMFIVVCKC